MRRSVALLAAVTVTVVAAWDAHAFNRRSVEEGAYVTAESEFGNGTVSGPVRHTSVGRQVRTPGGSWLDCETSCAETLRLATVDFWQSEKGAGSSATTHGTGLFGKLRFGW